MFIGVIGADDHVLQQAEGGNGSLELGVGTGIGRGLADILKKARDSPMVAEQ